MPIRINASILIFSSILLKWALLHNSDLHILFSAFVGGIKDLVALNDSNN